MLIKMNQFDIRMAKRGDGECCPIANAINRVTCRRHQIMVGVLNIYVDKKYFHMPEEVFQFRYNYDRQIPVSPIEFELPLEADTLEFATLPE